MGCLPTPWGSPLWALSNFSVPQGGTPSVFSPLTKCPTRALNPEPGNRGHSPGQLPADIWCRGWQGAGLLALTGLLVRAFAGFLLQGTGKLLGVDTNSS